MMPSLNQRPISLLALSTLSEPWMMFLQPSSAPPQRNPSTVLLRLLSTTQLQSQFTSMNHPTDYCACQKGSNWPPWIASYGSPAEVKLPAFLLLISTSNGQFAEVLRGARCRCDMHGCTGSSYCPDGLHLYPVWPRVERPHGVRAAAHCCTESLVPRCTGHAALEDA